LKSERVVKSNDTRIIVGGCCLPRRLRHASESLDSKDLRRQRNGVLRMHARSADGQAKCSRSKHGNGSRCRLRPDGSLLFTWRWTTLRKRNRSKPLSKLNYGLPVLRQISVYHRNQHLAFKARILVGKFGRHCNSYGPLRDPRFSYSEYAQQTITNRLPVWKRPEPLEMVNTFGAMAREVIMEAAGFERAEDS